MRASFEKDNKTRKMVRIFQMGTHDDHETCDGGPGRRTESWSSLRQMATTFSLGAVGGGWEVRMKQAATSRTGHLADWSIRDTLDQRAALRVQLHPLSIELRASTDRRCARRNAQRRDSSERLGAGQPQGPGQVLWRLRRSCRRVLGPASLAASQPMAASRVRTGTSTKTRKGG